MSPFFTATLLWIAAVQAFPTLFSRQSITTLTTSQIDEFTPYTYFAKAAYCPPSATLSWTCGDGCSNTTGFKPVASGGDGNAIQYWYVGYEPSISTVIVAHEGTNPSQFLSLLTDANLVRGHLDPLLYPGLPSDIKVHHGFRNEHSKTASKVLSAVQEAMSKYKANSVTLVGHSLGAALSLLDSVYLPLHLPSDTKFRTILYGLPRVGNKAFADYVDANLHVTHINNMKDPIPTVPGKFLGFVHPSGEVHIRENGDWVACPGQDNPSKECIYGDVPTVFSSKEADHKGPYKGITITSQCP